VREEELRRIRESIEWKLKRFSSTEMEFLELLSFMEG